MGGMLLERFEEMELEEILVSSKSDQVFDLVIEGNISIAFKGYIYNFHVFKIIMSKYLDNS